MDLKLKDIGYDRQVAETGNFLILDVDIAPTECEVLIDVPRRSR